MASKATNKNKTSIAGSGNTAAMKKSTGTNSTVVEDKQTMESAESKKNDEVTPTNACEAKSFPADEEEALFLGSDREYPLVPHEPSVADIASNSIWRPLVEPTPEPTSAALQALADSRRLVER